MLAPGEAIEKARTYLGEVIPDFAALHPKVEEIELEPDSSLWKITFSAQNDALPEPATLADLVRGRKKSKIVSVGAANGSLISVKDRF
jgi:hypothetical protein